MTYNIMCLAAGLLTTFPVIGDTRNMKTPGIVAIIAIVLIDFLGSGSLFNHGSRWSFLNWLYNFAYHLIVLGALVMLQD